MQDKIKKVRIKKEEKLSHIEKWRESGLSMCSYSRETNLPVSSLSKWVRSQDKFKSKFKPIMLSSPTPVTSESNMIEILVDNRIRMRLPMTTDPSITVNIIRGLM